jgi:hypothetical protein
VARSERAFRADAAHPGRRDRPHHRRHARLLWQRGGGPRSRRQREGDRNPQLPRRRWRDSDSGHAVDRARQEDQRPGVVSYRFVSDLPFKGRETHALDAFETNAIAALRADPKENAVDVAGTIFDRRVRVASPVVMGEVCVACHNKHPDSPKRDWKVGDVRGIQEISVAQPLEANIFAFKYLLAYIALAAAAGLAILLLQWRQAALIGNMNRELTEEQFLARFR